MSSLPPSRLNLLTVPAMGKPRWWWWFRTIFEHSVRAPVNLPKAVPPNSVNVRSIPE
ncbi:hypothetical protein FA13DRAFT_1725686 [Coprinellus micaceus]|uniref:Uncharacterized protein n=1 Tax=Coprinellus micaceus TaxID=71717 RepID=A0A4Y7TV43_COPMI|nr:hypothetical protein FA13DRAFT_1725686 [Coprinellus micaceus]